jgi:hypothetical protein
MRWRNHLYPVVIEQVLDVASLAELSDIAANEADESGYLEGNQMYQDLRGYGWPDVARALVLERRLIAKLQEAGDLEAEAMQIDDERLDCFEPSDGLWGLDLGVLQQRLRCPRWAPYLWEAATQAASAANIKVGTRMSPSSLDERPRT